MGYMYKFNGQNIPTNGEVYLRTTSNVLTEESDTVYRIIMKDGICVESELVKKGDFTHGYALQTKDEIEAYICEPDDNGHPEVWTEVVVPASGNCKRCQKWSDELNQKGECDCWADEAYKDYIDGLIAQREEMEREPKI